MLLVTIIMEIKVFHKNFSEASQITIFISNIGALLAITYENLRFTQKINEIDIVIDNDLLINNETYSQFYDSYFIQNRDKLIVDIKNKEKIIFVEAFHEMTTSWTKNCYNIKNCQKNSDGDFRIVSIKNKENAWFTVSTNSQKELYTLRPSGVINIFTKGKIKITLKTTVKGSTKKVYYGF